MDASFSQRNPKILKERWRFVRNVMSNMEQHKTTSQRPKPLHDRTNHMSFSKTNSENEKVQQQIGGNLNSFV